MMKIDPAQVLGIIDVLLRALGTKILQLTSLLMTFGLFCWAMKLQSWLAFALAGAFGVGVLWPVLFTGWRSSHESS